MSTQELAEPIADTKEQQVEGWIREAVAARQDYEDASVRFAKYVTEEAELEALRPVIKHAVTIRLMDEQKLAATPADKVASTDAEYLEHLEAQRDVVAKKNDACTKMQSARLRAELALAAIRSLAGLI